MDAITKKKTLTSVFTALLVGSAFVGALVTVTPFAAAQTTAATVDHSTQWDAGDYTLGDALCCDEPNTNLQYNHTYNIKFAFIDNSGSGTPTTDTFRLCRPNSDADPINATGSCDPTGSPTRGVSVTGQPGFINLTFSNIKLNATSLWYLVNDTGTVAGADITTLGQFSTFLVNASAELHLTLSRSSFPVSTSDADELSFTVTVTNGTGGVVEDAVLIDDCGNCLIPPGVTTDADGVFSFTGPIQAVGAYTLTASKTTTGSGDLRPAGLTGSATVTVTARTLGVLGVDTTIRAGFGEVAKWNLTYPNGTSVFKTDDTQATLGSPGGIAPAWYNLSVRGPGTNAAGIRLFVNTSGADPGDPCASATATEIDPAAGTDVSNWSTGNQGCDSPTVWDYTDFGNFSFQPNTEWAAGVYSFHLDVNTAGNDLPEYAVSWTLSTTTPASVNLKLKTSPFGSGTEVKNLTVLPVDDPLAAGIFGEYTLDLQILGAAQSDVPETLASGLPFDATNITVTGDVLPVDSAFITNTGSGLWTIDHLIPTRVNGNVLINVDWKHLNTSITVPILRGADISVDKTDIVVDTTTTLTVVIKDKFANPVPNAKVYLYSFDPTDADRGMYPGVAGVSINGTGAPGLGQAGQYVFNVRPTEVGDLAVYGIIGSQEGTPDAATACTSPYPDDVNDADCRENRNFTYTIVHVVPAHDLALTISKNSTMASVTTELFLNSTLQAKGIFGFTSPGPGLVFFLNDVEWKDLVDNSTLPTYPQTVTSPPEVVTTDTVDAAGASINVTLDWGTYHVYVCSNFTVAGDCSDAKHDNRDTAPVFTVSPFHAVFTPSAIAADALIEADTLVNVTITDTAGNLWNGTLTTGDAALFTADPSPIQIVDGKGSFTVTGAGTVDNATFQFDPDGGITAQSDVDTLFLVSAPNVVVSPSKIPVGQTSTVIITVKALDGTPLSDRYVQLCGAPIGGAAVPTVNTSGCTGAVPTNTQGFLTLGVLPTSTGTLYLFVNGTVTATKLPVFAGLQITSIPAQPVAGDTVELTVKQVGASLGENGATVTVTKDGTAVSGFPQTTGTDGKAVLSNVVAGTYQITATKLGFDAGTLTLVVGAAANNTTTHAAHFVLSNLVAPSDGTVGTPIDVTADLQNTGDADGTAAASLIVNGINVASRSVTVAAGGTEHLGYTFTPTKAGTFNVTVRLADGTTLASKTVQIATPTSTTTTTTTTSTSTSTSTSTTTTTTSTPATPTKVPGFEIVALLGALAVAMLVLRRRN